MADENPVKAKAVANAHESGRKVGAYMAAVDDAAVRVLLTPGDATVYTIVMHRPDAGAIACVDGDIEFNRPQHNWFVATIPGGCYEWPCTQIDETYAAAKWGGNNSTASWTGAVIAGFLSGFAEAWKEAHDE